MPEKFVMCERCGYAVDQHAVANLSDPPFVGASIRICPTAVFTKAGYDRDGAKMSKGRK